MPKEWIPKRIRSEEDRGGGSSDFIRLDEGQRFTGYALFDGDPAVDEPGYYEYLSHWYQASRRNIPCASDGCPMCEEGDKPRTRANTLWLVTKDENGNVLDPPQLRIFVANWNVIKYLTEMRAEGDKIKGRAFRVSRLDDRGNYALLAREDKMTVAAVKEALKAKDAPDFEAMVTSQLRRGMEGLMLARAMDDTGDDVPAAKANGKKKAAPEPEEGPEPEGWPSEAEGLIVTVADVDSDNFILVDHDEYGPNEKVWGTSELDLTGLEEGDFVALDYFTDDENDKVATAAEKQEAEIKETGLELPDKIAGEVFEVVGEVDETNGTIPVRSEDLGIEFTLFIMENMKIDKDDYPVGAKIVVTCEKDVVGDMVATDLPEPVKAKTAAKGGRKPAGARKGA